LGLERGKNQERERAWGKGSCKEAEVWVIKIQGSDSGIAKG
jgi:hypothetical protein